MKRPLTPEELSEVLAMAQELKQAEGLDDETAYREAEALVREGIDASVAAAPARLPTVVVEEVPSGIVLCRGPVRFWVSSAELPQVIDSLITLAAYQDELDELRAQAPSGLAKAA